MLVLSRKVGEEIVIGNGIRVTVVALGNGRVKLGFTCPDDVVIDRSEVHEKRQATPPETSPVYVAPPIAAQSASPLVPC